MLELGRASFEFTWLPPSLWGDWGKIDRLLSGFLDRCPDFKLVIRTGNLYNYRDEFRSQAKKMFHLMAERNRIQFETSSAVDEYWSEYSLPHTMPTVLTFDPSLSRACEALKRRM